MHAAFYTNEKELSPGVLAAKIVHRAFKVC